MPLCAYFINGNCRFGSKCNNDHIDLKTLLKNESEAVIHGKQYLLSCFGPFKEGTNIPNFIVDQSFEEVRIAFLENNKNGNLQNYISNLMSEYNNAAIQYNKLKNASNEILQVVANIYNTSTSDQKNSGKTGLTQQATQNPFQSSNIFGGSTQQPSNAMSTANIFGQQSVSNNPFAQTTSQQTSVFGSSGSAVQQTTQPSSFSFALNQPTQPKPSIFGQSSVFGGAAQSSNTSIFGSTQPAQPTNTSIFGTTQPAQPTNASIFGTTQPAQPTNASIFGSTQPAQPSSAPIFGTNQSTNVFAQPVNNNSFSMPTSTSIFASSMQQPIQNPPQTMSQQSIFGSSQAVPQSQQNIFATQSQPFSQATTSIFGSQQPVQQQNVFQQPSTNVFSQFQTQNDQNSMSMNQEAPQMQSTNIFNASQPVEQQSATTIGISPFQIHPTPSNVNNVNPFQAHVATISDEHFYSKEEQLTPEDIMAFQSDNFTVGKIPLNPPSKNLCLR